MANTQMIDCHVHSFFSDDCKTSLQENIEHAQKNGLGGIVFTDHVDFDYPNKAYHFIFDPEERAQLIADLDKRYKNDFFIGQGLEIGFQAHTATQSHLFIEHNRFDFIINSVHAVDHQCLCSSKAFFNDKTYKEAYTRYLETVRASVYEFSNYDVLGHLGYIRRYSTYPDHSMPYKTFATIIDDILKRVIADGKGIEINTSGYDFDLDGPIPDLSILKRYKELGGKIITIGSDAHSATQVGRHFQQAMAIAQKAGFSEIAYFIARSPHFIQLC